LSIDEDRGQSLPGRWVNSHDLREGDIVFLRNTGPVAIRGVRQRQAQTAVCNLTIAGLHTFAVGKANVLVHNTSDTPNYVPESPAAPNAPGTQRGPGTAANPPPSGSPPVTGGGRNVTITRMAAEAQAMADGWSRGQSTRPIIDRQTGRVVGEITTGGDRVIRYPHTDSGTPQPHWNLEDKGTGTNIHVVIK